MYITDSNSYSHHPTGVFYVKTFFFFWKKKKKVCRVCQKKINNNKKRCNDYLLHFSTQAGYIIIIIIIRIIIIRSNTCFSEIRFVFLLLFPFSSLQVVNKCCIQFFLQWSPSKPLKRHLWSKQIEADSPLHHSKLLHALQERELWSSECLNISCRIREGKGVNFYCLGVLRPYLHVISAHL